MRTINDIIAFWGAPRHLAPAIAFVSAAALAFAYTAQYGFNYLPCILCLYQRIPYFAALGLSLAAAALARRAPVATVALLWLCVAAFLAGTGISGYHVGVESSWWPGPQACGSGLPQNASVEQLRAFLANRPIVDCGVPTWKLFGISMTGYNFALSLGLFVSTMFLLARRPRGA